jgi:ABC-type antimicrobial peptide transport system permease subunit
MGWGLFLGGTGIVIGLGASILLSRFISALLFDVSPLDPMALALSAGALLAACAIALVLPARRAARVDPSEALRVD